MLILLIDSEEVNKHLAPTNLKNSQWIFYTFHSSLRKAKLITTAWTFLVDLLGQAVGRTSTVFPKLLIFNKSSPSTCPAARKSLSLELVNTKMFPRTASLVGLFFRKSSETFSFPLLMYFINIYEQPIFN